MVPHILHVNYSHILHVNEPHMLFMLICRDSLMSAIFLLTVDYDLQLHARFRVDVIGRLAEVGSVLVSAHTTQIQHRRI